MTKADCEAIRAEMNKAFLDIACKYDIDLKVGNITYDDFGFTAKVEAKEHAVNGMSCEEAEFCAYCQMFGFTPSDYRMAVSYHGKEVALVGFLPKGRKYHCKLRDTDGGEFKATAEFVKQYRVCIEV